MNERMQQSEGYQQQNTQTQKPKTGEGQAGEYIDFEEVKNWPTNSLFLRPCETSADARILSSDG